MARARSINSAGETCVGGQCSRIVPSPPTLECCANTSPRPAGISASTLPSGGAAAACATACSVGTPTAGLRSVTASAFTVASPARRPVKLPGPTASANSSTSCTPTEAAPSTRSMSPRTVAEFAEVCPQT